MFLFIIEKIFAIYLLRVFLGGIVNEDLEMLGNIRALVAVPCSSRIKVVPRDVCYSYELMYIKRRNMYECSLVITCINEWQT